MWKNYLTVAVRSVLRNRLTYLINLFGLSLGLASCLLCYLHIQYELDFDKFNHHHARIMRVVTGAIQDEDHWVKVAAPITPYLKQNIPEIDAASRFHSVSYEPKVVVQVNDKSFSESHFMMADPDFLKIFSFRVLKGSAERALTDISAVAITVSTARKLFGDTDPMGRTVLLKDNNLEFQVAAILEDVPAQSHLHFDYLVSFENLGRLMGEGYVNSWGAYNFFSYVLLQEGSNTQTVEEKIKQISATTPQGNKVSLQNISLQPLQDIHFRFNRGNLRPSYDIKYIYIFSSIAIGLLLIACINYINLAIAMAIRRVKEIGVRKAVGAGKAQLAIQFMSEASLLTLNGLVLAIFLVYMTLPAWNILMDSSIQLSWMDTRLIIYLSLIISVVIIVSGSYLAFFAGSYKTTNVLKGSAINKSEGFSLQHSLMLLQFGISMILIGSTIIITSQMKFMQQKDLGFNFDQVLSVSLTGVTKTEKIKTLKNELQKIARIEGSSACSIIPGRANWHQTIWWEGQSEPQSMDVLLADNDFIRTFSIPLKEGKEEIIRTAAGTQYLVNESALSVMGWETALGKLISPTGEADRKPVAGLLQDFHYKSLHHGLDPMVLIISDDNLYSQLAVKLNTAQVSETIKLIGNKFAEVFPDLPFEFVFLDEKFNQLYKAETRLENLLYCLTGISIVLSLVGLYGIVSYNIENRTKEIAVRKILGISFAELFILFSKRYVILLTLASAMAFPVTFYTVENWLAEFTYRVSIQPIWFITAFAFVLCILLGVILLRATALQKINASRALKYE